MTGQAEKIFRRGDKKGDRSLKCFILKRALIDGIEDSSDLSPFFLGDLCIRDLNRPPALAAQPLALSP